MIEHNDVRNWAAQWIGRAETTLLNWKSAVLPAPYLRKIFTYDGNDAKATVAICGLGYYELYINGRKVGDHVLDPVVTHYDRRVGYVTYDVTEYLKLGENVIGVILGNGWYNSHTADSWHFDRAPWRDYPKLLLELMVDNSLLVVSDTSWKVFSGPIIFDGLRNGEIYDARLELTGWLEPDYDDREWIAAAGVAAPGGVIEAQTMPPCKVMRTFPVEKQWKLPSGEIVYDVGQNIAGWVRITVSGEAGTELIIKYSELLGDDNNIDQAGIASLVYSGEFQTDRYIMKGIGQETWEPRFTYHGFAYLTISGADNVTIDMVEARVVYTAFEHSGQFSCSDETLNRLQACTVNSYLGNFVGIPTDCPHREKNGWTGDAQLAVETGLFNFSAASSYNQWIDSFADVQRPSGQLPGIIPSAGWGFNWGSGPAWDSAFLIIPWNVYLFTGDSSAIEQHYGAMKKYVDYCRSRSPDNIALFGLGDWCHVDRSRIVNPALTSTAYYYFMCVLMAKFAEITGRSDDLKSYKDLARRIKKSFNAEFYRGNGIYANGEQTALGCALYYSLVEEVEKTAVLSKLVEAVKNNDYKVDFGILGAKYIPRVLADNGEVEAAYSLITQPHFPGWGHWLERGATTLWENWNGAASQNHIMFGDISAWMYQYLAGIIPDETQPGFKHLTIKPCPVSNLEWVKASCDTALGRVTSSWEKSASRFKLEVEIPQNSTATLIMPDGEVHEITLGKHCFESLIS
ncbi:MAG: glycoside hydrolase family 78 protein [Victivallaceae bacterium]|nr:glycoside hydrolase family 78 protein [Victivallaceae bacterium]